MYTIHSALNVSTQFNDIKMETGLYSYVDSKQISFDNHVCILISIIFNIVYLVSFQGRVSTF
jgi:hypothetical protein